MTVPARQDNAVAKPAGRGALLAKFAEKFGVDETKLVSILKNTCFKQPNGKGGTPPAEVTNEQMAALLIVADQYGLNPFTREIYAFPDKSKGIVPIVGVDGWARIINENPMLDGIEFQSAPDMVKIDDDARECPEWIEAIIYRKDRSHPIVVREYLDECYRPAFKGQGRDGSYAINGPWQSHTKRFLRHKALIQGARIAFGFAGVYDEDEGERVASARVVNMNDGMPAAIDVAPSYPAAASEFDRLARERGADMNSMAKFVTATAGLNRCPVDKLKAQAIEDMDGFWEAFESWQAKQGQSKPAAPKTPKVTAAMREEAAAACVAAGVNVGELETEFGAYARSWSYAQCQEALARAAAVTGEVADEAPGEFVPSEEDLRAAGETA